MKDDVISRQAAIDALDVLCQEHRYKIPGKAETYSQYNEAWQDALDRAEGAIGNLPSVQPKRGKWVWDGDTFDFERLYKCSECNKYALYNSEGKQRLSDFCPHCNADMRYER